MAHRIKYTLNGVTPLVQPKLYINGVTPKYVCRAENWLVKTLNAYVPVYCNGTTYYRDYEYVIHGYIVYWAMGIFITSLEHLPTDNIISNQIPSIELVMSMRLVLKMSVDYNYNFPTFMFVRLFDTNLKSSEFSDTLDNIELYLLKLLDWDIYNGLRRGLPYRYKLNQHLCIIDIDHIVEISRTILNEIIGKIVFSK